MKLEIYKFGEILTSRPAGREAALSCLAYESGLRNTKIVLLDFDGVLVMTPSWLSEFVQTLNEKSIKVGFLESQNPTVTSSIEFIESEIED
jgi:hypothetical protein